jgi:hypothetical protein
MWRTIGAALAAMLFLQIPANAAVYDFSFGENIPCPGGPGCVGLPFTASFYASGMFTTGAPAGDGYAIGGISGTFEYDYPYVASAVLSITGLATPLSGSNILSATPPYFYSPDALAFTVAAQGGGGFYDPESGVDVESGLISVSCSNNNQPGFQCQVGGLVSFDPSGIDVVPVATPASRLARPTNDRWHPALADRANCAQSPQLPRRRLGACRSSFFAAPVGGRFLERPGLRQEARRHFGATASIDVLHLWLYAWP